jgi:excisionase family DNA binding protein
MPRLSAHTNTDATRGAALVLGEAQLAALYAALRPLVAELVAAITVEANQGEERWLTPEQAARHVGVHRRTIYRALAAGALRGGRVRTARGGTRWRIRLADVDAWVEAKYAPTPVGMPAAQRSNGVPKRSGAGPSYRARARDTTNSNPNRRAAP